MCESVHLCDLGIRLNLFSSPLLSLSLEHTGALVLAANGHIIGADPDRIILKRIILTG